MNKQAYRVSVWPFTNNSLAEAPAFTGRPNKKAVIERIYTAITFANAEGLTEVKAPAYLISVDKHQGEEWVREKSHTLRQPTYG